MKVRIRGKSWDLSFVRTPDDADGLCDPPDTPSKRIRISHTLKGERQLDATIHELLHASHWDLDEVAINDTATDIARILWKLGYRKTST